MNIHFLIWIFFFIVLLNAGCSADDSSDVVLSKAKHKLEQSQTIQYAYLNETNNVFNETKYSSAATIDYFKLDKSLHGFGLHAFSDNEEYFFDGYDFIKLKHEQRVSIQYDRLKIENDSSYFSQLPFFSNNPMMFLVYYEFDYVSDTFINNQESFVYREESQQESHSDASLIVRYQKSFFIDKETSDISQIQDIIIRNRDTLQIVDHYFTNYIYGDDVAVFPEGDLNTEMEYVKIDEADEDEEFTFIPIREGEKLTRSRYDDVNGDEVSIYGEDSKSSLVMFSFIGCAPCEMALKDFKEVNYHFSEDINFYYSSFQNASPILKRYLEKKEFPNTAFGKESGMIEDFSLYHAPSFVLFDSTGTILKVIEGYNEEVKKELFEMLILD